MALNDLQKLPLYQRSCDSSSLDVSSNLSKARSAGIKGISLAGFELHVIVTAGTV
jgi:hypothetical protein